MTCQGARRGSMTSIFPSTAARRLRGSLGARRAVRSTDHAPPNSCLTGRAQKPARLGLNRGGLLYILPCFACVTRFPMQDSISSPVSLKRSACIWWRSRFTYLFTRFCVFRLCDYACQPKAEVRPFPASRPRRVCARARKQKLAGVYEINEGSVSRRKCRLPPRGVSTIVPLGFRRRDLERIREVIAVPIDLERPFWNRTPPLGLEQPRAIRNSK